MPLGRVWFGAIHSGALVNRSRSSSLRESISGCEQFFLGYEPLHLGGNVGVGLDDLLFRAVHLRLCVLLGLLGGLLWEGGR